MKIVKTFIVVLVLAVLSISAARCLSDPFDKPVDLLGGLFFRGFPKLRIGLSSPVSLDRTLSTLNKLKGDMQGVTHDRLVELIQDHKGDIAADTQKQVVSEESLELSILHAVEKVRHISPEEAIDELVWSTESEIRSHKFYQHLRKERDGYRQEKESAEWYFRLGTPVIAFVTGLFASLITFYRVQAKQKTQS